MEAFKLFLTCIAITSLPNEIRSEPQPPHYAALRTMAEAAIEDCYEDPAKSVKVEITDEGFEELLKGSRVNLLRNTKCLRYCIMRKNGLLNETNALDQEKIVQIFDVIHPQIWKEQILKVLTKCSEDTKKQTDNCEHAYVAAMCILDELKEEGVTDI